MQIQSGLDLIVIIEWHDLFSLHLIMLLSEHFTCIRTLKLDWEEYWSGFIIFVT